MEHRVAKLSEGQRECLRLVYRHMETKEIARELGISPDGVNQRIKTAMRILGVARRRDAALILAEAEGADAYPPLVYLPRDVAIAPDPAMLDASTEGRRMAVSGGAMREDRAIFQAFSSPAPATFQLPLPIRGVRPSDLSVVKRLGWIFGLILLITLAFGFFITGFEALSRLGRTLG